MSKLFIETHGIDSWKQRLADPEGQWVRRYSAFETAVSWEYASRTVHGLPEPIRKLFARTPYAPVSLIAAVAEHRVPLKGSGPRSQCDVWAVLQTPLGVLSLSVEGKVREAFGTESLDQWLEADGKAASRRNRAVRWQDVRNHLPPIQAPSDLRYQLLHRCAAAVIEAKRLRLRHAAFVVQSFGEGDANFGEFARFCQALGVAANRGALAATTVGEGDDQIALGIGWVDCAFATDRQVLAVV